MPEKALEGAQKSVWKNDHQSVTTGNRKKQKPSFHEFDPPTCDVPIQGAEERRIDHARSYETGARRNLPTGGTRD